MAIYVLAASLVLQFTAALLAARLIRRTKNGLGWSLITAALMMMTARRAVGLYQSTLASPATEPSLQAETIALGISILMVFGVLGIGRLFQQMRTNEERLSGNEEELAATVGRLETTLERLNRSQSIARLGNWDFDLTTEKVWWSDEIYRLIGMTPSDNPRSYDEILALCVPEQRKAMHAATMDAIETGDPYSFGHGLIRKDGTRIFVHDQGEIIYDHDGNAVMMSGTVQDITDQKQMMDALRTSEARLASSHKIASLGFYEWDMIDNSATWSPEIDDVFGFPFNEIANTREKYRDLIHPDDVQSWLRMMKERQISEEPQSSEYRLILPDNSVRNVIGVGQVTRNKSGAPIRINGTLQDITAVRNTEASLRQVTAEQKVILDNAQIGIGFVKDRRIIRSNDRLAKMLGRFRPEKLENIEIDEFFPGKNAAQKFFDDTDRAFRKGMPYESERLINGANGTDVWIRTIGSAVDPADPSKGSIWLVEDVTRRKSAEEALRHSHKMDAVGQLTGGIAHDFNNLLGVIIGNLEILEQLPNLQKSDRVWAERAQQAALRGADLTSRLLQFSRSADSKKQMIVLNNAVTGMEDLLRRSLTPEIQIQTNLTADLWLTELELADLENAVVNLAINARDAMPGGGILRIETANISHNAGSGRLELDIPFGDYVLLTVSDTGTGMPPEVLERVFDPFYSTKEQDKGTGLGLSMVYGFVERSSGHIRASSRLKVGTTFRMYFPRIRGLSAIDSDMVSSQTVDLPLGDEVVLLVDDEVSLRDPTATQLTKLGYQVLTAENGPSALKMLQSGQKIDLLLSDIVMSGGMSGHDLAKQAHVQFSDLRILLTSGNAGKDMPKRASQKAGEDFPFLPKPYQLEQLALKVREVLGQPKS